MRLLTAPKVVTISLRGNVPTNDQLLVAGITASGELFIFALTRPEPEPEDHAVDAGDAAWAFSLPQPSITHVPFVAP